MTNRFRFEPGTVIGVAFGAIDPELIEVRLCAQGFDIIASTFGAHPITVEPAADGSVSYSQS